MKALLTFFLFILLPVTQSSSKTNIQHRVSVGVCQLLRDSGRYDGKFVQVRGHFRRTVEWSAVEEEGCEGKILVVDPKHPSVIPRAHFRIVKDEAWRKFEKVSQERLPAAPNSVCVGPCGRYKYDVVATFLGRVDSREVQNRAGRLEHRPSYGHLGQFRVRLVLKSVSDVVAIPTVTSD
jgi:hypothetical protein